MASHILINSNIPAPKYNTVINHPITKNILRYLGKENSGFRSGSLIESLYNSNGYPNLSVSEILRSSKVCGATLVAAHADIGELDTIPVPFMTFLSNFSSNDNRPDLFVVDEVSSGEAVVSRGNFGSHSITRDYIAKNWTGIVIFKDNNVSENAELTEVDLYKSKMEVIPNFLSGEECRDLIDYCEKICFSQSLVLQRRGVIVDEVADPNIRSSTSALLFDRNFPVLAKIYQLCADLEGVSPLDIETIQCVRYTDGQKFRPHFDGSTDLPRLTTYLIYLNDCFEGGETYFSMFDQSVVPVTGTCLRFQSCDRQGRIIWQSEHGGMPVTKGVKYALNIWVRAPLIDKSIFSIQSLKRYEDL